MSIYFVVPPLKANLFGPGIIGTSVNVIKEIFDARFNDVIPQVIKLLVDMDEEVQSGATKALISVNRDGKWWILTLSSR